MKTWLRPLGLVLAGVLALPLQAQTAAEKPVRIVVPFAAGGPADVVARVLAPRLAAGLKRTVIVENRVGATVAIGAAHVAKSAPDGDALQQGTRSIMAANPGKLSYASSGVGSTCHLGAEMFRSMTVIEWTQCPTRARRPPSRTCWRAMCR